MQAVVLAAGAGTRFRRSAADCPKPLYKLYGVPLVERAIRTARLAGCDEVVVVTGAEAETIEETVLAPGRPWVRTVRAEQWSLGNGASLLAAKPLLREPFLLLMADHVLDPILAQRAVAAARRWDDSLRQGAALLVVDPRLGDIHDLHEATKVCRDGDRIVAIGKHLTCYDAVDTGVFVGSPGLLAALERVAASEDSVSLTAGATVLAEQGQLIAVPVSEGWWVDVDDGAALKQAECRLLAWASASGGDGIVARFINRRFSRRLTAALAHTRLQPNHVSILAFGLAVGGALAFAAGAPLAGGTLCQLASVVDGCDGELARLRLATRPEGGFLDTVLDRYADAAVVAGLAAGASFQGYDAAVVWWLALVAMAGMPLSALMKDRLQLLFPGRTGRYNPLRDDPPWLRWVPGNRDGRYLLVFLAGVLGQPLVALILLALVAHALAIGRVLHVMRAATKL